MEGYYFFGFGQRGRWDVGADVFLSIRPKIPNPFTDLEVKEKK